MSHHLGAALAAWSDHRGRSFALDELGECLADGLRRMFRQARVLDRVEDRDGMRSQSAREPRHADPAPRDRVKRLTGRC